MDDDGPPVDAAVEALTRRCHQEGLDLQFVCEPFLEAAELGDADSLRRRFTELSAEERRGFVRSVDQQGRTGLQLAVARGDIEVASVLLDAQANPNDVDSSGTTALHLAAGRGSSATLELLLHGRAEPSRKDDRGETPLMWAQGAQATSLLLSAGADASVRSCDGRTALVYASARGDAACAAALLEATEAGQDAGLDAACAAATAAGHTEVVDALRSYGARAPEGAAVRALPPAEALHEAARRGDAEACGALVCEVDVDAEVAGETALLLAAGAGAGAVVEVLLRARADANHADAYLHESPLTRAVLAGGACELLWLLLEARANALQADLTGRTPCDVAVAWGHERAAEMLRASAAGQLDLAGMD